MPEETLTRLEIIRKRALSIALIFIGLFMFLSLVSFHSADLSGSAWPVNSTPHNICGKIGAATAGFLMNYLGAASFLFVLLAITFAVQCLMKTTILDFWLGIAGGIAMIVAAAAICHFIAPNTKSIPSGGGIVGYEVGRILVLNLNKWGAWLVSLVFFILGMILTSADDIAIAAAKKIMAYIQAHKAAKTAKAAAIAVVKPAAKPVEPPKVVPPIKAGGAVIAPPAPKAASAATAIAAPVKVATQKAPEKPVEKKEEPKPAPEKKPVPIKTHEAKPAAIEKMATQAKVPAGEYQLPPITLLDPPPHFDQGSLENVIRENSATLEKTLADFDVPATVVGIEKGPTVTRYEVSLGPGVKVQRLTTLSDNIAMAVKVPAVRIFAPIPGKSTAGIEVPNSIKEPVCMMEMFTCQEYINKREKYVIPIMLGKDACGAPVISDLARMPHLLIAGTTGSGKSVCLNSILTSILMLHKPQDMRLILVDPKMVEMGIYERIPHLLVPVVNDMKRAPFVLEWATRQMDERYDLLAKVGVKHITEFNALGTEGMKNRLGDEFDEKKFPTHMPYFVVIIDEFADMMMVAAKDVESYITRLAQKARAVGIHIILATQRPSVDVITGLIKTNFDTRISFKMASKVDSRTILDHVGAEKLLGSGDLLFHPPGKNEIQRVQGTYSSDREIKAITDWVKKQGEPAYMMNIKQLGKAQDSGEGEFEEDDMYEPACKVVLESRRGSVSLLQRKLGLGYGRASRLIDRMANDGIVGEYKGSKAREVVLTLDEWEEAHGIPPEERTSAKPASEREMYDDEDDELQNGEDIDREDN